MDCAIQVSGPAGQWLVIKAGEEVIGRISNVGEIDIIMSEERMKFLWQNSGSAPIAAFSALFCACRDLHDIASKAGILTPVTKNGIIVPKFKQKMGKN